eukprot:g164.t1
MVANVENDAGTAVKSAEIDALLTSSSAGSESGKLEISAITAGSASKVFTSTSLQTSILLGTDAGDSSTGSLKLSNGGMGVASQVYTGGVLCVESIVEASSKRTGALTIEGGLGVAKDARASLQVYANGTTDASSFGEGALLSKGGFGIAQSLYTAGIISASIEDGVNNGVTNIAVLTHKTTTGSSPTAGIGTGINFGVENNASNIVDSGSITFSLADGNDDAEMAISCLLSGSEAAVLRSTGSFLSTEPTTESTSKDAGSLQVQGGMGIALSAYFGGKIVSEIGDTNENVVSDTLVLKHTTSGNVANGIGVGISIAAENDNGDEVETAAMDFTLTAVTDNAEIGKLDIQTVSSTMQSSLTATGVNIGVSPTIASGSSTTGSFISNGGAGIALQLYTGGIGVVESSVEANASSTGAMLVVGGAGIGGSIFAGSAIVSESTIISDDSTRGALVTKGGLGVGKEIYAGGIMRVKATTVSEAKDEGSIVLSGGGVGLAENLHAGSVIVSENTEESISAADGCLLTFGGMGIAEGMYSAGATVVTQGTQSVDKASGCLTAAGGAGIALSMYAGGQIASVVDDNRNSQIDDILILKHTTSGNVANGIGVGISIAAENDNGDEVETAAMDFTLTAVTDNAEIGKLDIQTVSSTMQSSLTATGVNIGVSPTIASGSSTTGSFISNGGAGIALQLYTGGIGVVESSVEANASSTGAMLVVGGAGIGGSIFAGSAIVSESTIISDDSTRGALVTKGGLGVGKEIYAGGIMRVKATTVSEAKDEGSIVLSGGGVGLAENLYAGSVIVSEGSSLSATSTLDGALRSLGGLAVADKFYASVAVVNKNDTASTSTVSGSIVTKSGLGIAKSIYAGYFVSRRHDSSTGISNVLDVSHTVSGGSGQNNIGIGISAGIEDQGNHAESGSLDFIFEDASASSEDTKAVWTLITSGNLQTSFTSTTSLAVVTGGLRQTDSGTVTQTGSGTSGVTLNKNSGIITTVVMTTGAGACTRFTVSNSKVEASDSVHLNMIQYSRSPLGSFGFPYVSVSQVSNGSFNAEVCNLHPSNNLNGILTISMLLIHV